MSDFKLTVKDDAISRYVESMSNISLGTDFFDKVGAVIGGDIIGNIEAGQQADGSNIKQNSRSTREKKRRRGNSPIRSLIDIERRFIRRGRTSWTWDANSKSVTVSPTSVGQREPLDKLVENVQRKGYTGWFGISKKGKLAIRELFRIKLKKILDAATK